MPSLCLLGSAQSLAQNAYITQLGSNTVSVIDTATNTVIATIPVGVRSLRRGGDPGRQQGLCREPTASDTVSVIDTATNTVTATIPVGTGPLRRGGDPGRQQGLCRELRRRHRVGDRHGDQYGDRHDPRRHRSRRRGGDPGRQHGLCRELGANTVSVIDTATNTVTATIPVGAGPLGVAVTPDGSKVYVANASARHRVGDRHGDQYGDRHDPRRHQPRRRGGDPGRQQGLCRELRLRRQHRVGDRHGDEYGDRHDPRRHRPRRRGGDPGRQQGLCRELRRDTVSVIATATNTVANTIYVFEFPVGVAIQPLFTVSPSEVATTASGLAYSRVSKTFNGTVTLTNISSSAVSGPFQMVFTGLPAGVTLANATGEFSGSPYLTITVASVSPGGTASLMPGQSATASVQFDDPSFAAIKFTPLIYSGSL